MKTAAWRDFRDRTSDWMTTRLWPRVQSAGNKINTGGKRTWAWFKKILKSMSQAAGRKLKSSREPVIGLLKRNRGVVFVILISLVLAIVILHSAKKVDGVVHPASSFFVFLAIVILISIIAFAVWRWNGRDKGPADTDNRREDTDKDLNDADKDKEHSHAPSPPAPAGESHAHGNHGHGSGGGAMLGFLWFCVGVAILVGVAVYAQNHWTKSPAGVYLPAASAEATAQLHARAFETPVVYNLNPGDYCQKGAPADTVPLKAGPDWGEAIAIPQGQSFHCTGQMTNIETVEFQCQPYDGADFGPCGSERAVAFRARSLTGLDQQYYSWMEDWEVQR